MGLSDFFNKQWKRFNFGGGTDMYTRDLYHRLSRYYDPGQATYETITDNEANIYNTTAALQIVISRKANMKASGIWRHYDKNNNEFEDSDILQRLRNPNPLQSGIEFIKAFESHRCVWGAAFINELKGFSSQEVPSAIWAIIPSQVTIDITGNIYRQTKIEDIIKSYVFDKGGSAEDSYDPNEILFLRLENMSHPIFPESPFVGLNMEITNIRKAMGYRNVILDKKGAIGILSSEEKDVNGRLPMEPDEKKRIEAQYQKDYGLSDSQMKIIITETALKWQPMTYPTKDLLLFEEVDANTKKIIDRYGLNENMFSSDRGTTLSDSGTRTLEGVRMAYADTIIPESEDDAKAFTKFFKLDEKGERLELDYSHIQALKDDEVKKSEVTHRETETIRLLVEMGYSLDDARDVVGWIE